MSRLPRRNFLRLLALAPLAAIPAQRAAPTVTPLVGKLERFAAPLRPVQLPPMGGLAGQIVKSTQALREVPNAVRSAVSGMLP